MNVGQQQHVKQNFYSNSVLFTAYRQRVALLYNHYKDVTHLNLLQYHNVPLINEALWTANNILFTSSCWSHAECLRGGNPGLSIYICLILTICTHKHYPIGSCRPQTQVYKPLSPAFFSQFLDFSPYEQHIFVHDESSLCFLGLADLSIHKQRKNQASWVSATDSYGEKNHFLPCCCILTSEASRGAVITAEGVLSSKN